MAAKSYSDIAAKDFVDGSYGPVMNNKNKPKGDGSARWKTIQEIKGSLKMVKAILADTAPPTEVDLSKIADTMFI